MIQPDTSSAPPPPAAVDDRCPVECAMAVIGGKWKVPILWQLLERGTRRFAELQRELDGIAPKVLSQQLRELERDGMVRREVFPEVPPRVEYSLTPLGESLRETLAVICAWGEHLMREGR